MVELSPAARAVLAAVTQAQYSLDPEDVPNEAARIRAEVAAALRAAADLVVPRGGPFLMTASEDRVRHQLLAIAAELEGSDD